MDHESTQVIHLKRDFDRFLSQSTRKRIGRDFDSSRNRQDDGNETSLDRGSASFVDRSSASFVDRSSVSMADRSVSMTEYLEKQREERLKDAEIARLKVQIARLESNVSVTEVNAKRARVEYDKDITDKMLKSRSELDKVGALKHRVKMLTEKEQEACGKVKGLQTQLQQKETQHEQMIAKLQTAKLELEEQLTDMETEMKAQLKQEQEEVMRTKKELQINASKMAENEALLGAANRRNKDLKSQLNEMEECSINLSQAQCKIKDLEKKLQQGADDAIVTKSMKTQLANLAHLEKENRKLKDENLFLKSNQENVFMLKEEANMLQSKLGRAKEKGAKYDSLLVQYEELQQKFKKWEVSDKMGNKQIKSPWELTKQIQELQTANATLLEKQGHLQTSLHLLEKKGSQLEAENNTMKEKLSKEGTQGEEFKQLVKRLNKKVLLLSKERDGFKSILDSYESEATVNIGAMVDQRVNRLEDTIQGYKRYIKQLETDLESNGENLAHARALSSHYEGQALQAQSPLKSIESATSQFDQKVILDLRNQVAELEKRLEDLKGENEMMQLRIENFECQGDFDPRKTKVIHMPFNPMSLAIGRKEKDVEKLKAEKKELQEKVKTLQAKVEVLQADNANGDLTLRIQEATAGTSSSSDSKQLEGLKSELKTAELKNQRLMEAFQKKSQEIREVCYQLLGYRVDIPGDGQSKLMSIYAESREDILLFKQGDNQELQLMTTAFSESMLEKFSMYLKQGSIPAFLSSITLDLYSKQTMLQDSTMS